MLPQGLLPTMAWMYELSPMLHLISGGAEILGGLGLILAGLTGIQTQPTPLAAAGLALVMVLATAFHLPRGEAMNLAFNLVLAVVLAGLAYARWRVRPLG